GWFRGMRGAAPGSFWEAESRHPVCGIVPWEVRIGWFAGRRRGAGGNGGHRSSLARLYLGGFWHAKTAGVAEAASIPDSTRSGADGGVRVRCKRRDEARRAAVDATAWIDVAVPVAFGA